MQTQHGDDEVESQARDLDIFLESDGSGPLPQSLAGIPREILQKISRRYGEYIEAENFIGPPNLNDKSVIAQMIVAAHF